MQKERKGLIIIISAPFIITVDYTKTWEEHISSAGFDKVSKNIKPNRFEISGSNEGVVNRAIVFLSFDKQVSGYKAGDIRKEEGLYPIKFEYQLAFCAQYPSIRDKSVNLDSQWECECGHVYRPYQNMWLDEWQLCLGYNSNVHDKGVKFFALRG